MRTLIVIALLSFVLPATASEIWSNLWRNADQHGEALLQHGDASNAAKVFADPRRKAYAELTAGDYAGAAQNLSNLHDSDADYNRGNALAHTGNLQGALEAYDAALKSDPNNQDARHNRELVANALKQQPPQQQNAGSNNSKDNKHEGQQGKGQNSPGQGKDGDQTGKKGKTGQQGNSGQSGNNSGNDSSSQNKPQQNGTEVQKSQEGKSNDGKSAGQNGISQSKQSAMAGQNTAGKNEQAKSSAANSAQTEQSGRNSPAKDDTEQARHDAIAAIAKTTVNGMNGDGVGIKKLGSDAFPVTTPKSEQQIAQEQWLRSIPDDPSGLLRRKFLIEHLMRQQKEQP